MNINNILNFCVNNNVSDFHISTDMPPMVRVDGEMRQLNVPPLDHIQVRDIFPTNEKPIIRTKLSQTLQGVVLQKFLKKIGGGRVAAYEIMVAHGGVRNFIRENKSSQIYGAIQTGQQSGMQTLDYELEILLKRQLITKEEALKHALNKYKFA